MPSKKKKDAQTPVALKEKGNKAFADADYIKAVDMFTKAIELDPNNHTLYSNRSAAYLKLDQFTEAI